jgi:cardiolipin synthase (CMP-forming)
VGLFDAGTRKGQPVTVHDRVVTAANAITAVRLAGLPVFVLLAVDGAYGMAFLTLAIVGTTDWVDGYVARRFNQVTRLGKWLDPLIDRFLLATAALTLLGLGFIPVWVVVAVVARDVVLLIAGLVVFHGNPGIPVSRVGKFATACLLIGVPSFLLGHMSWAGARAFLVVAYVFSVTGIVAYYAAGWGYIRTAVATVRAKRQTAATP